MTLYVYGCESKDTTDNSGAKIYYTTIESGTYYERWAEQLRKRAEQRGCTFDVGYAENSVEEQDAQVKNAVTDGYNVLLCGLVSSDTATEMKAAARDTPIVFINNAPDWEHRSFAEQGEKITPKRREEEI